MAAGVAPHLTLSREEGDDEMSHHGPTELANSRTMP